MLITMLILVGITYIDISISEPTQLYLQILLSNQLSKLCDDPKASRSPHTPTKVQKWYFQVTEGEDEAL